LVVLAQVMVFAIAQASKFKAILKTKFFGHTVSSTDVRFERQRVFSFKSN
jgi:hypothetical protein